MKWVVVLLIVLVVAVACGDVVDGEDTKVADLEARFEALEDEVLGGLPMPWRESGTDASYNRSRIDKIESKMDWVETAIWGFPLP